MPAWSGIIVGADAWLLAACGMAAFEPVPGLAGNRWPQSWQKIDPSRFTRPHC
jgi:hypothetical protein